MKKETINKPRLVHSMNYDSNKLIRGHAEINGEPSLTKPHLALTIQEILFRYSSGRPVPQLRDHEFHMDLDLPDVRTLDLVDRENLYNYVKNQVIKLEESVKDKQKKRSDLLAEQNRELSKLLKFAAQYEKDKIAKTGEEA